MLDFPRKYDKQRPFRWQTRLKHHLVLMYCPLEYKHKR